MDNCLFCKIIQGEIDTKLLFDDDISVAFADINPQAPTHVLVVPKKHIPMLNDSSKEDTELLGHLLQVVRIIAAEQKIEESGYRVIINNGRNAGQEVDHLHVHLLGGKPLGKMICAND